MEKSFPDETSQSGNTNDGTAPINALPGELFLEILLETIDYETLLIPQLHNLAQVCTYWFQSIMSNPRFWRVIDLDTKHLAPLMIRRNPSGPLAVRCWVPSYDNYIEDLGEYPVEFLEVARTQAHRWESLKVGDLEEQHLRLFDIPTPALENLDISDNYQNDSTFPLPDAPRLKHVLVWGIHLRWDSPSLRGLESISINCLSLSLQQIVSLRSESPALEWFAFKRVDNAAPLEERSERLGSIISLPHLQGLDLDPDDSLIINSSLLKLINAPRCRILEATMLFDFIEQVGPTFTTLTSLPLQAAKHIRIQYDHDIANWTIESTRSPPRIDLLSHAGWRCDGDEASVQLTINRIPYTPGSFGSVIDIVALSLNQTEVALDLFGDNGPDIAHLFNDHPTVWNNATTLSIHGYSGPKNFQRPPFPDKSHYGGGWSLSMAMSSVDWPSGLWR